MESKINLDRENLSYPRIFKTPKSEACNAYNIVPIHRWFDKLVSYALVSAECPCNTCIVRATCYHTLYHSGWVSEINCCDYFESYVSAVYNEFIENRSKLLASIDANVLLPECDCIMLRILPLKAYAIIIHRSYPRALESHHINNMTKKIPGSLLMFFTLVFSTTGLKINPFNLNDRSCGHFTEVVETPIIRR